MNVALGKVFSWKRKDHQPMPHSSLGLSFKITFLWNYHCIITIEVNYGLHVVYILENNRSQLTSVWPKQIHCVHFCCSVYNLIAYYFIEFQWIVCNPLHKIWFNESIRMCQNLFRICMQPHSIQIIFLVIVKLLHTSILHVVPWFYMVHCGSRNLSCFT